MNWSEIGTVVGIMTGLMSVGGWVLSLYIRSIVNGMGEKIREQIAVTYMPRETLNLELRRLWDHIGKNGPGRSP